MGEKSPDQLSHPGGRFSYVFFFIPFWGEVLLGTTVFLALGGSQLVYMAPSLTYPSTLRHTSDDLLPLPQVMKPILLLKNQEVIDKVLSKGAALKDKVAAKAA